MLAELQQKGRWLSHHAQNTTSQCGEDGIIAKALSLIPDRNFWCVEFGAWDGKLYSNTHNLVQSQNYRGVFIEADPIRFRELENTHGASGRHMLRNAFVGFSKSDGLDSILAETEIPKNFDLLSVDIDGNDYYVWEAVEGYRPRLVVIEFNPTIASAVLFVQKKDSGTMHGASAASIVALARRKGYELIAVTAWNLLFVAAEHYGAFGIPDNSLAIMRDDSNVPQIFVGYDGHVFLSQYGSLGSINLTWHGLRLKENNVQVLPAALQKYQDQYNSLERFFYRVIYGIQNPRRVVRRLLRPITR